MYYLFVALFIVPQLLLADSFSLSLTQAVYSSDAKHLKYVSIGAPKQGSLRLASNVRYNSFNPYLLKGISAAGLDNSLETLAVGLNDDPYTVYGLLAKSFDYYPERNTLVVYLHKNITFQNNKPVTSTDVVRSFYNLIDYGHPSYKKYFSNIVALEAVNPYAVALYFHPNSSKQEHFFLLKSIPVFDAVDDFANYTSKALVGTGPYYISGHTLGKSVSYTRDKKYWGRKLWLNQGRHNFDTIHYQVYSDATVTLSAFKTHDFDLHIENVAKLWHTSYVGPMFDTGQVHKVLIPDSGPHPMQAFIFNLRKPMFADVRVRQALNLAFDFDWINTNIFYNSYTRSNSYFLGTPFAGDVSHTPSPSSHREQLLLADKLLNAAGWIVKYGKRVHSATLQPLSFTMLVYSPSMQRICLPFKASLEKLGITMHIRLVSANTWIRSIREFDYDMTSYVWPATQYPGVEQKLFWHSSVAATPGSLNIMGVKDSNIDALVDALAQSHSFDQTLATARKLDNTLLQAYYTIPHWYLASYRVAYWNDIHHPATLPPYGIDLACWWHQ